MRWWSSGLSARPNYGRLPRSNCGMSKNVFAEGTDPRYGARHLRRAIDRLLVQPISNLLATEQVRRGDWVRVDADPESREIFFLRVYPPFPAAVAEMPAPDGGMSLRFPESIK